MKSLEYYKNRFYLFYSFIKEKYSTAYLIEQSKELVDRAYEKGDLKKLAKIDKELNVWLREMLHPTEKEELLEIFKNELDEDNELNFLNKINKIVNQGKIYTNDEYEMILQRVEEIYSDKEKSEEVMKLNKLLAKFQR